MRGSVTDFTRFSVGPYEKLSLVREITTQTTVEEYSQVRVPLFQRPDRKAHAMQVYGLTSGSLCGSEDINLLILARSV